MAVITLASAAGAPGVTTTALGLALTWPRDVVLVDADRDPAQAVAAGFLRGVDLAGRGLAALARAHREQRSVTEEVRLQLVELEQGGEDHRWFLPGFNHAAAAGLFQPVWADLVAALVGMAGQDCDVLVDAGRVGRDGLPGALVAGSDQVLLCTRSTLRALAAARLHLPTLQQQLEAVGSTAELGLLLVGAERPYGVREIEAQFSVPVLHSIAWEPRQAEVFSDGAPPPRQLAGGALVRSCRSCASTLDERLRRRQEVLVGQRPPREWGLQ